MGNPFIKHLIQYNPIDYLVPKIRALYRKLGILEFMDTRFYWLAWRICRFALGRKLWHVEAKGISNIPKTGAAVFAPNHSNALDPFFSAMWVHRKVHWVSKIENYHYPIYRPILQCTGSIPLRRGESDQNAIRLIRKEIEKGEIIGMFPEGTRTKTGHLQRFHTGAARFCLEYNIPYIPVGITNSYENKMGDHIKIRIGKPVYPKNLPLSYENIKAFTEQMRQSITKLYTPKVPRETTPQIPTEVVANPQAAEIASAITQMESETLKK